MSNIVTYQSLQIDSLLSVNVDFSVMKDNFIIMNDFIKSFSLFQKRFVEMQKSQKLLNEEVNQFKQATQSQLTTMNEVMESRGQISRGKSSVANQQLAEIKKSIKQLRQFVAESTRQQHQSQQMREKQLQTKSHKIQKQLTSLQQQLSHSQSTIKTLQQKVHQLTITTATRHHLSQLTFQLEQQKLSTTELTDYVKQIDKLLVNTNVEEFKSMIESIDQSVKSEISEMKVKLANRATITDVLKLEEMLIAMNQYAFGQVQKIMANKYETKKALVFLEKRINSLVVMVLGENQQQREGFITTRQVKCISCTKDLGQVEGKLDKVKNWSIFPTKQYIVKEKYAGFGAGFQSIIQSTIAKKGGEVKYDEKGRMVEPFNLTGTIQGSLMKTTRSQQKIQRSDSKLFSHSPSKGSLKYQTSFMHQYGRESNQQHHGINITEEYYHRFRGLESFVTLNKKNESKTIQQNESMKS